MPVVKDRCICQICICGKHHCGDHLIGSKVQDSKVLVDGVLPSGSKNINDIQLPLIKEINLEESTQKPKNGFDNYEENVLIEDNTQRDNFMKTTRTFVQRKRAATAKEANKNKLNTPGIKMQDLSVEVQQKSNKSHLNEEEALCKECFDEIDLVNKANIQQRKTWKTSPEQVEELTRSLSRMRNDEHGNSILEKTKNKTIITTNAENIKLNTKSSTKKNIIDSSIPMKVISTKCNNEDIDQQQQEGFLPPLTGFSDSDSSFSSIVCSSDDCDKIHCICETLKKTHLEEHKLLDDEHHPQKQSINGINYINVDNDKWIVMRPKRARPRDNLKLEGPMELETTFRSTYGGVNGGSGNDNKSKLSNGSRSSSQKQSPQLYFNTRRGRNSGSTPLLKSAKRKTIRNRPRTSLKTGGDGYWSTNNRDAYKNFIIVDGEAKTISDNSTNVKLPKVVSKTTTMTSKEKNRCKFDVNQTIDDSHLEAKPLRMLDGEEIHKFEKKSYVTTSNEVGEMMTEKLMKKVRCQGGVRSEEEKDSNKNKELKTDEERIEKEEEKSNYPNIVKYRPYDAYQIDHIKNLGLLEMKPDTDEKERFENYRPHLRRLHETSDDFNILTGAKTVPNGSNAKKQTKSKSDSKVENKKSIQQSSILNGHAVMAASKKPFILPQRIQRYKNESSINIFEGDMEFTTTNKASYRNGRINSEQRKRTAGRRSLKSGRRRNLFRQSSDSIFARPDSMENSQPKNNATSNDKSKKKIEESIYKSEFGDQSLYCPALDIVSNQLKMTSETGGHKYYNLNKFN